MTYKNNENNSKPGYGKVLPFQSRNNYGGRGSNAAAYASRNGAYAGPGKGAAQGGDSEKHCPTCQCAMHGMGGLENLLPGQLPGGAVPVAYQITIYALPPELLKGYDTGDATARNGGAYNAQGRYKAANDNDSYGGRRDAYDHKRAA